MINCFKGYLRSAPPGRGHPVRSASTVHSTWWKAGMALALSLAILLLGNTVHAAESELIDDLTEKALYTAAAVTDSQDRQHFFYGDGVVYHLVHDDGEWETRTVDRFPGSRGPMAAAIDPEGTIHLVYQHALVDVSASGCDDDLPECQSVSRWMHARYTNEKWTTEELDLPFPVYEQTISMAIDSGGGKHYVSCIGTDFNYVPVYMGPDGTTDELTLVGDYNPGCLQGSLKLALDSDDTPYVLQGTYARDLGEYETFLFNQTPGGSWEHSQLSEDIAGYSSSMMFDGTGTLHIAYRRDMTSMVHVTVDDVITETVLDVGTMAKNINLVPDAAGNPLLVFFGSETFETMGIHVVDLLADAENPIMFGQASGISAELVVAPSASGPVLLSSGYSEVDTDSKDQLLLWRPATSSFETVFIAESPLHGGELLGMRTRLTVDSNGDWHAVYLESGGWSLNGAPPRYASNQSGKWEAGYIPGMPAQCTDAVYHVSLVVDAMNQPNVLLVCRGMNYFLRKNESGWESAHVEVAGDGFASFHADWHASLTRDIDGEAVVLARNKETNEIRLLRYWEGSWLREDLMPPVDEISTRPEGFDVFLYYNNNKMMLTYADAAARFVRVNPERRDEMVYLAGEFMFESRWTEPYYPVDEQGYVYSVNQAGKNTFKVSYVGEIFSDSIILEDSSTADDTGTPLNIFTQTGDFGQLAFSYYRVANRSLKVKFIRNGEVVDYPIESLPGDGYHSAIAPDGKGGYGLVYTNRYSGVMHFRHLPNTDHASDLLPTVNNGGDSSGSGNANGSSGGGSIALFGLLALLLQYAIAVVRRNPMICISASRIQRR